MTRTSKTLIALCAWLACAAAWAANDQPTKLELATQDDDLRAGGEVHFELRMNDGVIQSTPLIRGESLAGSSTKEFSVRPKPPYTWSDVKDFGLRVRPHPGDGLLLQPDQWKVYVILRGLGAPCPAADRVIPGEACFNHRNARFHFSRPDTQWAALNPVIGLCNSDEDCGLANFCSDRVARCAPGTRGADRQGCVRLSRPQPACAAGQTCNEAQKRCVTPGCEDPDRDGDGAKSIACGGTDCDDADPRRAPGFAEVCDTAGHDEDCDASTIGDRDSDRDGFTDAACWNDGAQF